MKSKIIKDFGLKKPSINWRSYFNNSKQDIFMWQGLSELIANTILKNITNPININIRQSVSSKSKANYLIVKDDSCGIALMQDRYEGIWSNAKGYDQDKFMFALYGSGLIQTVFSLGRLKNQATKTKFDENCFKVEPALTDSNGLYDLDREAFFGCVEIENEMFEESGTSIWIDTNKYEDGQNPCTVTTKKSVEETIHQLEADWAQYLNRGDLNITYAYINVDKPNETFTRTLTPEFPKLAHHKNKDSEGFPTNEWEFEKERIETELNGETVYVDLTVGRLLSPDKCEEFGKDYDVQKNSPYHYGVDNCGFRLRQNDRIMTKPLAEFKDHSGRDSAWSIFGFIDIYKDCGIEATVTKNAVLKTPLWNAIVEKIDEFLKEKKLKTRVSKGSDPVQCDEGVIRDQVAEYIESSLKQAGTYKDFNVHTEYTLPNGKRIDVFQEHKKDRSQSIIHECKLDAFSTDDFDAVLMYVALTGVTNVELWSQKLSKTSNTSTTLDLLKQKLFDNFEVELEATHKDYRNIPGIKY